MTEITVLFPSSYPKNEERLARARADVEGYADRLAIHWPRAIPARSGPTEYLAGTEEVRCAELVDFLFSPRPEVGWFGRGGFGVTRLLSTLAANWPDSDLGDTKRWMGYSDITALFAFAKRRDLPVQCIHGPMLCAFSEQPNKKELLDALEGTPCAISVKGASRAFEGPIWGGNLAVLASLCGTPWLPVPEEGTAVLLEDVDEAPYRLDRYFTQLRDSGFFARTRTVLLGTFTGFEPREAAEQTVSRRCEELGLQVLGQVPVGHSEPHFPVFLERPYRLEEDAERLVPLF